MTFFFFFFFSVQRLSPHPALLSTLVLAWISPPSEGGSGGRPGSIRPVHFQSQL